MMEAIQKGDRFALAKAITLVESERAEDQDLALEIIQHCIQNKRSGLRIGISGPPGVGKSTLIESLGSYLLKLGKRPAVLAVDPSSQSSGGSILGDKTRMPILSQAENAFVRPSPAGKTLGGVSKTTRESILLLESASFDPVIVETVGVGQSEISVESMTDLFILVIAPGGGDEIQGIKRGVMEQADILLINKMDGKLKEQALETKNQYENALHLLRTKSHGMSSKILGVSSLEGKGMQELWKLIGEMHQHMLHSGFLQKNRKEQDLQCFDEFIEQTIHERLFSIPGIQKKHTHLKKQVGDSLLSPYLAAHRFLNMISEGFNG
jgi:LAO/AO transport system kinase